MPCMAKYREGEKSFLKSNCCRFFTTHLHKSQGSGLILLSQQPQDGATGFPFGWGVNNGANIPVVAGSYRVIFNDIDGYYHLFAK